MKGKVVPLLESDKNTVNKIIGLISRLCKATTKIGDEIFTELKTHFPAERQRVDKFRTKRMYPNLSKVIGRERVKD